MTIAGDGEEALLCLRANAQLLSIGIKGGMNFSTLTNSKTIPVYRSNGSISLLEGTSSYRKGFTIGGLLALKVPLIGIQAEILYSRQGVINEANTTLVNYKTTVGLNYLNIPVLLQFYFLKIINFEIGPQFGFLMNAKQVTDFKSPGNSKESVKLNGNELRESDLSLALGVGFKLPKFPLGINARYTFGLRETFLNYPNNKKPRNGVLQLTLFLKFKVV